MVQPRKGAGAEFGKKVLDENEFRLLERLDVLVLHQEQSRQIECFGGGSPPRGQFCNVTLQRSDPLSKQTDHVVRIHRADQRERRLEPHVLLHRAGHEVGQPVLCLEDAVVGDAIHGALGTATLPLHFDRLDIFVSFEGFHDGVERSEVQAHALVVTATLQGLGNVVRVTVLVKQRDQGCERQGVVSTTRHNRSVILDFG